jgi:hypothetical protein
MGAKWPLMPSTPEQQARFDAAVALSAETIADAYEEWVARMPASTGAVSAILHTVGGEV